MRREARRHLGLGVVGRGAAQPVLSLRAMYLQVSPTWYLYKADGAEPQRLEHLAQLRARVAAERVVLHGQDIAAGSSDCLPSTVAPRGALERFIDSAPSGADNLARLVLAIKDPHRGAALRGLRDRAKRRAG